MLELNITKLSNAYDFVRSNIISELDRYEAKNVAIWGAGQNGYLISALLYDSGISTTCFFDEFKKGKILNIDIKSEPSKLSSNNLIIIALDSSKEKIEYIKEMCNRNNVKYFHIGSPFSKNNPDLSLSSFHKEFFSNQKKLLNSIPQKINKVSIWGCGKNGWATTLLLLSSDKIIHRLYDTHQRKESLFGIQINTEPERVSSCDFILIAMNGAVDSVKRISNICNISRTGYQQVLNDLKPAVSLSRQKLHQSEKRETLDEIKRRFFNPQIKVISFDVFDTLLCRPVLAPTDLFWIVEKQVQQLLNDLTFPFCKLRVLAEKIARKKGIVKHGVSSEDISIDEIYDVFVSGFEVEPKAAIQIKDLELETEMRYLRPRKAGKELFQLAKLSGKRIFIVSDVYFSKEYVENLLHKHGYKEYERCDVSSEYRLTKITGSLYRKLLKDSGVFPDEWIHVGDNVIGDMKRAREVGIGTVYLPSAVSQFWDNRANVTMWFGVANQLEPSFRLLLGLVANKIFDNPFDKQEKKELSLFNGNPKVFGYYAGGPWFFFMIKWLLEETSKNKYSMLHLIARDGYIPLEIYNRLKSYYPNSPNTNYLYISRIISHVASMTSRSAILLSNAELPIMDNVTVRVVLRDRFFIKDLTSLSKALQKLGYLIDQPIGNYEQFITDCLDDSQVGPIIEESLRNYQGKIKCYYQNEFSSSGEHAIFDIGYTGKIQSCLNWATGMNMDGFYFSSSVLPNADGKDPVNLSSYFGTPINDRVNKLFARGIAENVMSDSNIGSMIGLKENENGKIQPIFAEHAVNITTLETQRTIQSGILQFIDDIVELFGNDLTYLQATPVTAFHLMNQYMNKPTPKDAEIFLNVEYENGSTGKGGSLICNDLSKVGWKIGYDAICKPRNQPPQIKYNSKQVFTNNINLPISGETKQILWIDYAQVQDKYAFVSELSECNASINYLLLDGFTSLYKFDTDQVEVINPPDSICQCFNYQQNIELPKELYIRTTLQAYAAHYHYLLQERNEVTYEQALSGVIQAYNFTCQVLHTYNPHLTIIWNEFFPLSKVAQFACDMMKMKTAYLEFGILPGTIQIDYLGQVGESWIARESKFFNSLKITKSDLTDARKTLRYYKSSKINRREQPDYGKLDLLLKGINKKIIFLAGHNNYSSGVFPYDLNARNLHSPIYRDSWELFEEIAKISKENNWFLVFKPHPYSKKNIPKERRTDHFLIVDSVNINECIDLSDVVVTILSQVSYMALIRDKSVVMLGKTALLNKGCSYEAFSSNLVASQIKNAIAKKNAVAMQKNWVDHVARLLKYYLYLYKSDYEDELPAKSVKDFADALILMINTEVDDLALVKYNNNL